MMIRILQPDFRFEDDRGNLVQLVHEGYQQYNILFSKKGAERGSHYHKQNNETFYVISGALHLKVMDQEEKEESYLFQTGEMFLIPPFVTHSFLYDEDTFLASMYSKGGVNQDGTKDIYEGRP